MDAASAAGGGDVAAGDRFRIESQLLHALVECVFLRLRKPIETTWHSSPPVLELRAALELRDEGRSGNPNGKFGRADEVASNSNATAWIWNGVIGFASSDRTIVVHPQIELWCHAI